jgi:hypothetical protein
MDKKQEYIKREAKRSRKNRLKTKEKAKLNQAFYDFVARKYKFVVDEFYEEEYCKTSENNAESIPTATATVPPYQRFPDQTTQNVNGMNLLTDLTTINGLDLDDMNFNLFDDPYLTSILDSEPLPEQYN